jgi:7-keto-8-aminopelargonate synthetase-like enzyme
MDRKLRARLVENTRYVKESLASAGISVSQTPSLIFSLIPRSAREISLLRRRLLAANIFPPHLKYPGGPPAGYFRFALSSEHSRAQLKDLLEALASHHQSART